MMNKTEEQWKKELTPEQYNILRKAGTEPPFTGKLLNNKESGVYMCAACGQKIFSSDKKLKTGLISLFFKIYYLLSCHLFLQFLQHPLKNIKTDKIRLTIENKHIFLTYSILI